MVVAANNNLYELGVAGSLAIAGGAGIAVPVGVRVNLTTDASIADGVFVERGRRDRRAAGAKDSIVSVVVGAGAARWAWRAAGVTILNVTTKASAPAPSPAGGDVLVDARTTPSSTIQIGIAGGFVGVGATVGVAC